MEPYYILKTNNYTKFDRINSPQQMALPPIDCTPKIDLVFNNSIIYNFDKYKMTSENIEKLKGRAYGNLEPFDEFISINYSDVYYSHNTNCLYFHSKKQFFNQFEKTFRNSSEISYNKINIDFKEIINNQNALDIKGIWFGNLLDANVRSQVLMGNKVDASNKYLELLNEGDITNLTLIYQYKDEQLKIMITKDGGVIFYDKLEETDALMALDYIYSNLISQSISSVS